MARQIVTVALVFFAIVGMAYAAPAAEPPKASAAKSGPTAAGPGSDTIGTIGGSSDAAPVGGPVPDGAFATASAPSPSNSAALEISAILGIAASAVVAFFH